MKLRHLLVLVLLAGCHLANAVGALGNAVPGAAFGPGGTPVIATAGVQVGAGGVLTSTLNGATVNLTIQGVSGGFFGAAQGRMAGIAAVTSAQWAAGITAWYNTLSSAGKPYGQINTIRVMVNSCNWTGCTGIDPYNNSGQAANQYYTVGTDTNGRTVYSAAPSCASNSACLGTGPGHEISGNSSVYQGQVETTVANILGATSILGYQMYVILDIQWTAPPWHGTGQLLLPLDQPAMPAPIDLTVLQQWAALYGNDPRILIEPYNEPFGTQTPANYHAVESAYLGNGNGNPVAFNFPTTTTSPTTPGVGYNYIMGISGSQVAMGGGGTSGSPNTAQAISLQQDVNVGRAAGSHNVWIIGAMVADGDPTLWAPNGGNQSYLDPYTIGGIAQSAMAFHAYSYTGSLLAFTNIQNGGGGNAPMPIIATEAGSMVGFSGSGGGYVVWRSHNWSTAECCWANFAVPVLSNIYPNDGSSYSNAYTISGMNPWNNPNVPVGNNGSNTTQIPTGSNFRPGAAPVVRLRDHAANDDYFEQLMTGTGMY
jgi:hypothetical protein